MNMLLWGSQQSFEMLDNPLRRFAIPERGDRALLPLPFHESCERGRELVWIGPNEFIGADRDGLRPLSSIAQGEARYAKNSCLLSNAAGISNDSLGMFD